MTRPSRFERWSATTTRQIGFLWEPILLSRNLTAISATRLACRRSTGLSHQGAEVGHPALGDLAHDLAHLLELLDQLLDRVHVRARAMGNSQPPRPVDELRVTPFLRGHREDDGLDAVEFSLVDLDPPQLLSDAGDHPEQRLQRTEAPDLPQLVEEVVEPEFLLAQLALELGRLLLVIGPLSLLDQAHHVA